MEIDRAAKALADATSVVVFTGAGVSAESGVPTFRDSDGLWAGHAIEAVATPGGYARDPALVWGFYNARRANVAAVEPNPAHDAIAELERLTSNVTVVTQNVDGLHQRSGSTTVLELHGRLSTTRCIGCGAVEERGLVDLGTAPQCPQCGSKLRPNVVWFGEELPQEIWRGAKAAVAGCDVLLVVGTSAVVYPAAGLIQLAKSRESATIIECNLTPTGSSHHADIGLYGPAGVLLPQVLKQLRSHRECR